MVARAGQFHYQVHCIISPLSHDSLDRLVSVSHMSGNDDIRGGCEISSPSLAVS